MKAKTYDRILLAILGTYALGIVLFAVGSSRFAKFFSSDAAPGWIQAIGAIIALGVAVWLPERARREQRAVKHRLATHFLMRISVMYNLLRQNCNAQDFKTFAARRALLLEETRTGDVFASLDINEAAMSVVLAVRSRAIEAYHLSASHTASGDWAEWESFFRTRHAQSTAHRERLRTLLLAEPAD